MKQVMKRMVVAWAMASCFMAAGQSKVDEQRMDQDIEVAENILGTLARQQLGKRNFFPLEVSGAYMPGYGVTLRIPQGGAFNFMMMQGGGSPSLVMENVSPDGITYTFSSSSPNPDEQKDAEMEIERARQQVRVSGQRVKASGMKQRSKAPMAMIDNDSLTEAAGKKFMIIAKSFLADYGDVISQLRPDERIIITNRGEDFEGGFEFRWPGGGSSMKSSVMSAEAKREDIMQLKQGKITRDQFMSRLTIVNAEASDKLDPDLEVFSSMLGRLYQQDLSKTYYTEGNVSYERLKDFGVVYYMRVYSSNQEDDERWSMPTLSMNSVSTPERNKKVTELYPKFENTLKDNLLDYARTIRSLKDEEVVSIHVKLTKCTGCGIPATLEVSVKNSVLKDYSMGKINKDAALAKVIITKGGIQ